MNTCKKKRALLRHRRMYLLHYNNELHILRDLIIPRYTASVPAEPYKPMPCIVGQPSSNHVLCDIRAQGHCLISQSIKGLYCSNIIKNTRKALNSTTRDFTETCVGQLAFSTREIS